MPIVKLTSAEKTTFSSMPMALRSCPPMTVITASQRVCRRPNTLPASKDFLQDIHPWQLCVLFDRQHGWHSNSCSNHRMWQHRAKRWCTAKTSSTKTDIIELFTMILVVRHTRFWYGTAVQRLPKWLTRFLNASIWPQSKLWFSFRHDGSSLPVQLCDSCLCLWLLCQSLLHNAIVWRPESPKPNLKRTSQCKTAINTNTQQQSFLSAAWLCADHYIEACSLLCHVTCTEHNHISRHNQKVHNNQKASQSVQKPNLI